MIDELFAGSFRGAVFFVTSASTAGGRKQVKHEYPYSDRQKIEDLGFHPRNFKLTAIIPGATPTDPRGYLQKRDELLAALEQSGVGTLSHPFFSNTIQVVARPYTLNETMQALGRGEITLEFDYSNFATNPIPQQNSLSKIERLSTSVIGQVASDIAGVFRASFPLNFESAISKLTSVSDAFGSYTRIYNQITSEVSSYGRLVTGFADDITQLIGLPTTLGQRIGGLISPVASLYNTPRTTYNVSRAFFNFGDDDPVILPTTLSRQQRSSNNAVITNAVQTGMLATAYQVIGEIDFATVDDVQATQTELETQYQKIVDTGQLSDDMFPLLLTLRTQVNDYLEQAKLTAPQIVEIETKVKPLSVIAFDFYGYDIDLDGKIDQLIAVNSATDITFTGGTVEVVTDA